MFRQRVYVETSDTLVNGFKFLILTYNGLRVNKFQSLWNYLLFDFEYFRNTIILTNPDWKKAYILEILYRSIFSILIVIRKKIIVSVLSSKTKNTKI